MENKCSPAEWYVSENFSSDKFIMVVVFSRSELISFYQRRGYQKTGSIMDYPLLAAAGIEVGDRSTGDLAVYPDDDLQAALVEGKWQFAHKDGSPSSCCDTTMMQNRAWKNIPSFITTKGRIFRWTTKRQMSSTARRTVSYAFLWSVMGLTSR